MSLKASAFVATSLDGFIARQNGEIDWLPESNQKGEDYGYRKFFESVDAIVMGRKTYEKVLTFNHWPYGKKRVIVLSHNLLSIPREIAGSVEHMSCSASEVINRLSERGMKHLYIDGGKTIQEFLGAGLIQEIIITRIPILIGAGIPLFGPLDKDVKLRHIETRQFPNGFVQSRYEIKSG